MGKTPAALFFALGLLPKMAEPLDGGRHLDSCRDGAFFDFAVSANLEKGNPRTD